MTPEPRRPPPPFDLVVVTGFLGAGKTTLLNRLLAEPGLADTLVLINEFGEVGLDHLLVERVEGDMLVLTSGCLCCSIRGDLVAALEDALRARDNGRMRPFARVVIETTGLADPAPVIRTIMSHPYLRRRFEVRAVVGLVDALLGARTLRTYEEALKQAAMADRLVLTKTDLADARGTAEMRALLGRLNPGAPILEAAAGEADARRLFGGPSYDPAARSHELLAWLNAEAHASPTGNHRRGDREHEDNAHGAHDHGSHDVNRHDARIRAFVIRERDPVPAMAVSLFLEILRSAHGAHVLRMKGIVALIDDPARPLVLHLVQHVQHPPIRLDGWPDSDHGSRLVFIVKDLDYTFVEGLWAAALGRTGVDQADLASNPLVPSTQGLLS